MAPQSSLQLLVLAIVFAGCAGASGVPSGAANQAESSPPGPTGRALRHRARVHRPSDGACTFRADLRKPFAERGPSRRPRGRGAAPRLPGRALDARSLPADDHHPRVDHLGQGEPGGETRAEPGQSGGGPIPPEPLAALGQPAPAVREAYRRQHRSDRGGRSDGRHRPSVWALPSIGGRPDCAARQGARAGRHADVADAKASMGDGAPLGGALRAFGSGLGCGRRCARARPVRGGMSSREAASTRGPQRPTLRRPRRPWPRRSRARAAGRHTPSY
jgi:hypothetical protein